MENNIQEKSQNEEQQKWIIRLATWDSLKSDEKINLNHECAKMFSLSMMNHLREQLLVVLPYSGVPEAIEAIAKNPEKIEDVVTNMMNDAATETHIEVRRVPDHLKIGFSFETSGRMPLVADNLSFMSELVNEIDDYIIERLDESGESQTTKQELH